MTPILALQAAAVYAAALVLVRLGAARRPVLIAACLVVAALPALGFAPRWSPPAAVSPAVLDVITAVQEPAGPAAEVGAPSFRWPDLTALWAAGAALCALRLAADLLAVRRLRASAHDREGDVATSDAVGVPMATGVLDPLILLPPDAARWSADRRAAVLAHERAHLRGHDNLWLLLARAVAAVHWFNPLAWRLIQALRDACEHAADEAALQAGADPHDYAATLVDLARRRAPAVALAMADRSGLQRRVHAVLAERPRPSLLGRAAPAVLVLLAVGTATAAPRQAAPAASWDGLLAKEADRLMADWKPEGVALLVLDAHTGAVVAQADRGGLSERRVSPGSILKPFTVAAALESGVTADQAFADGSMASILARSSNPGAIEIARRAGQPAVEDMLRRVGLPAPALPLERLALGDGVLVTPIEVGRAWVHLAGHGAISAPVAARVRELLVGAVEGDEATGRKAAVPGTRVAGKTGTAQLVRADGTVDPSRYLSSFVGLVPADDPTHVVLISVAGAQGESVWGGEVAAPAFRRIVEGM